MRTSGKKLLVALALLTVFISGANPAKHLHSSSPQKQIEAMEKLKADAPVLDEDIMAALVDLLEGPSAEHRVLALDLLLDLRLKNGEVPLFRVFRQPDLCVDAMAYLTANWKDFDAALHDRIIQQLGGPPLAGQEPRITCLSFVIGRGANEDTRSALLEMLASFGLSGQLSEKDIDTLRTWLASVPLSAGQYLSMVGDPNAHASIRGFALESLYKLAETDQAAAEALGGDSLPLALLKDPSTPPALRIQAATRVQIGSDPTRQDLFRSLSSTQEDPSIRSYAVTEIQRYLGDLPEPGPAEPTLEALQAADDFNPDKLGYAMAIVLDPQADPDLRTWTMGRLTGLFSPQVMSLARTILHDTSFQPVLQSLARSVLDAWVRPQSIVDFQGYEMLHIEAGVFDMGSPIDEQGRRKRSYWELDLPDEEALHQVRITRPFEIGATEVTQELYVAVMGENPVGVVCDSEDIGPSMPVACISWFDGVNFCNRLSILEGLEPAYIVRDGKVTWNKAANGYRLPTEAEWEYAARAGTNTRYAGTDADEDLCRYADVPTRKTKEHFGWTDHDVFECEHAYLGLAPVAAFEPNPWGLYDMTGNVSELVWDWFDRAYPQGMAVDPTGPTTGTYRVSRGGSWRDKPSTLRLAYRGSISPTHRETEGALGFRVVRGMAW